MSLADIGKHRDRSRDGELPQDIDGMGGSRARVLSSLRSMRAFVDNAEAFAEAGEYRDVLHQITAIGTNFVSMMKEASTWYALGMVQEGVYRNPKGAGEEPLTKCKKSDGEGDA